MVKLLNKSPAVTWISAALLALAVSTVGWTQSDDDRPIAPSYYDDEDLLADDEATSEDDAEETDEASDEDFFDTLELESEFGDDASLDSDGVEVDTLPALPFSPQIDAEDFGAPWDTAVFRGLDKVTARISVFEAPLDEAVKYGRFEVTVRKCNKRPPEETPNTTAFVEVVEQTLDDEQQTIFSGWMFASSPGLHAVEHAVYDVWLIDCKANSPVIPFEAQSSDGEEMNLDSTDAEELTFE